MYKTTNLTNGKYYIGKHQTEDLDDGYLGSGKLIKRAIAKYGIENFKKELLFVFDNEQEMNDKEKELVVVSEETYNLCPGGQGGFGYINENGLTNRTLGTINRNIAIKQKYGVENPTYIPHVRQLISERAKTYHRIGKFTRYDWNGKTHREESKRKMSVSKKGKGTGKDNSQFGSMWITNNIISKKIKSSEPIPEGWYKGRSGIV